MFPIDGTRATLMAALALCTIATPGHARQVAERADLTVATGGSTYYNRPGATWADHEAEAEDCATIAGNTIYAWSASFRLPTLDPIMTSHPTFQGFMENCMVLKGWRVVQMNPWKAQPYARAGRAALINLLSPLVGAEPPEGSIVRAFSNEAARGDTVFSRYLVTAMPPRTFSIRATNMTQLRSFNTTDNVPAEPMAAQAAFQPYLEPLTAEELLRLPADSAVVIARVRGIGQAPGGGFILRRMGGSDYPVSRRARALEPTDFPFIGTTPLLQRRAEAERHDAIIALPVVPGRYRIAQRQSLGFCFGSPSFEIKAGETVYLGDFQIAGEASIAPEMALDPASAFLAGAPERRAGLRMAEWVNGSTAPCQEGSVYALEFPGFPFADGYVRGDLPEADRRPLRDDGAELLAP